jgi:hypothetical protein
MVSYFPAGKAFSELWALLIIVEITKIMKSINALIGISLRFSLGQNMQNIWGMQSHDQGKAVKTTLTFY